jgi:hypothetical protein
MHFGDIGKGLSYSGNSGGINDYFSDTFPVDGVVLWGWLDGSLGTKSPNAITAKKNVLTWNSSGCVGINCAFFCNGINQHNYGCVNRGWWVYQGIYTYPLYI